VEDWSKGIPWPPLATQLRAAPYNLRHADASVWWDATIAQARAAERANALLIDALRSGRRIIYLLKQWVVPIFRRFPISSALFF
jgi:hypothetical protein